MGHYQGMVDQQVADAAGLGRRPLSMHAAQKAKNGITRPPFQLRYKPLQESLARVFRQVII